MNRVAGLYCRSRKAVGDDGAEPAGRRIGRRLERHWTAIAWDIARAQVQRRSRPHQGPARIVIGIGQQCLHRHVNELRIAVEFLPVRERQLGAFSDRVNEVRTERIHGRHIKSFEQRQGLQKHRCLAPCSALANRIAMVIVCYRGFFFRPPPRHVVAG